jgi:hypothetical protein
MGRVSKGAKCSVAGCQKEAVRSLSIDKVTDAGLEAQGTRRAYLCKEHYKQYKKATKTEKKLDKWRHGGRIT